MCQAERLRTAGDFVERLRVAVDGRAMPASDRVRAAASCFGIAQTHHHAVVVLLVERLFASSFALLRVEIEAFVRGEWLAHCASDQQVSAFLSGVEPPSFGNLVGELERLPAFDAQVLTKLKNQHWASMCDFTHTGGRHASRWITADGVQPTYDDVELGECLVLSEIIGALAALGIATLAEDESLAREIFELVEARSAL